MSERIILTDLDEQMQEAVADTRRRVAALHAELPRWGLVVWTAGNVSERVVVDRGDGPVKTDLFVIKPSGVSYDELTAETMVVCTLDGEKIDDGTPASLTPSSDTAAHAYVYRHRSDVGGVVHTHSPYATAWAARREPIPCALTMMGDEFGGDPDRTLRPHRRRLDRPRHCGDPGGLQISGGPHGQPRPLHRRQGRARRRQGRRHV